MFDLPLFIFSTVHMRSRLAFFSSLSMYRAASHFCKSSTVKKSAPSAVEFSVGDTYSWFFNSPFARR